MNKICNKHRINHNLVRLLVELEFDLDTHCKLKVNGILHNYNAHSEWKYFIEK